MVVLGIDPGSTVTGYGIVRKERGRLHYIGGGYIRTRTSDAMEFRLSQIHEGLSKAIEQYAPDQIAIEAIFQHKSSTSALKLGQARGVALLAAGQQGYEAYEYNPSTVKRSVGAHGRADKTAIAKMVQMVLGVTLNEPADVTDALAIAITHCAHAKTVAVQR